MAYHPVEASHFPGFASKPKLVTLILSGDVEGTKELLASGVDIDAQGFAGRPAIYWATTIESAEPLRLLIEHGAEVNVPTDNDDSPILRTAQSGDLAKLRMLLDAGADPNTKIAGHPVLFWIATSQHHETARLLIEYGADVNLPNALGDRPISAAAPSRWPEMLRVLLRANPDVTTPDHHGTTPLEAAINYGRVEAVQMLLDAGAALPAGVEDDSYWEAIYYDDSDPEAAQNIATIRRIVQSLRLASSIETAMPEEAPESAPRRNPSPGPL